MKILASGQTDPIDWDDLRRRLARAVEATSQADRLSPEQVQAILAQRARALAVVPARPPLASEVIEVMVFRLGHERYALETEHILEVARPGEPTPVPGASNLLRGLVNRRGEVLPVFDLRKLLCAEPTQASDLARLLVLGEDRADLAALVDEVCDVVLLRVEEIHASDRAHDAGGRTVVRGVTSTAIVVLDGTVLLADERLTVIDNQGG
jgi:purine-binding chemotaxis protein CheW